MQSIDNVLKLRKGLKPDDPNPDIFDILWAKKLSNVAKDYTITGNPLPFLAKKAQTAKSTKVTMSPMQDLHGYDNPWPAGGGKNLFNKDDESEVTNMYINVNNNTLTSAGGVRVRSVCIECKPNTTYTISKSVETARFLFGYISDELVAGVVCDDVVRDDSAESLTITTGANATYLISYLMNQTDEETHKDEILASVQIEEGSTATSYTPYSNICPISGRRSVEIKGCGKNLFDKDSTPYASGKYINASRTNVGEIPTYSSNNNYNVYVLEVIPNTTYTFGTVRANAPGWATCDINGLVTRTGAYGAGSDGRSITITMADNDSYLYLSVSMSETYKFDDILQVEINSSATTYESYAESNDVTISFGETVYGGTLDVETGVLMVDKKLITIKDYDFSYTSSSGGVFRTDFDDIESMTTTLISSALRTTNVSISGMPIYSVRGGSGSARQRIFIKMPDDITTRTALNNAIGDETICYTLAEPTTITLTPSQIQILKGQNTIWIEDEGVVMELTYRT